MPTYSLPSDRQREERGQLATQRHQERAYIEEQAHVLRRSGGYAISAKLVQRTAIQKAFEYFQDETWDFGYKSGKRMDSAALKRILNEVRVITGYDVSWRQFRDWLTYYLQFGHLPSRKKAWKGEQGRSKRLSFTANDDECLQRIIEEQPQLYLDEIVTEMKKLRGKIWHPSTLWKRMHDLGYSLKVAVHRARQASENEQALFYQRLDQFVLDPQQILLIDETHKSRNASRRRRAWGKKGIATVIPSYFEEDFLQQFTLIGVANIFGFVPEVCEIVHRNERLENRGTVDTERFELFIEKKLVPILGNYEEKEPNSVVILDNATIHMSDRIEEMINDAGAILLFTAPYSPDINPIEYFFSTYKKGLARNSKKGLCMFDAHFDAIHHVTPEAAMNTFRHCLYPGSDEFCERYGQNDDDDEELFMIMTVIALFIWRKQH